MSLVEVSYLEIRECFVVCLSGARPNHKDNKWVTPLHRAAAAGHAVSDQHTEVGELHVL